MYLERHDQTLVLFRARSLGSSDIFREVVTMLETKLLENVFRDFHGVASQLKFPDKKSTLMHELLLGAASTVYSVKFSVHDAN